MEFFSPQLFPETVTENPLHHTYQHHHMTNAFDFPLDDFNFSHFPSEMYPPCVLFVPETAQALVQPLVEAAPTIMERPKTETWSNSCSSKTNKAPTKEMSLSSPSSQLISFGTLDSLPIESSQLYGAHEIHHCQKETKRVGTMRRPTLHTEEHLIAERERRKKLSQSFIALSAIIPGLKKLDKASILDHAIKYMKQLQERVKKLEEDVAIRSLGSVVIVKKSLVLANEDTYSSAENSYKQFEQQLPEIEARVLDKHVLFRIHCKKQKGCLTQIFREIEKLNLSILDSSVLSFGSFILEVTIIAQMDVNFCMNIQDLVKNLHTTCKGLDEASSCNLIASGNGCSSQRRIGLDL